ncbi:SDR family oxidoreductase [Streptomyces sp. NPDC046909]|uniref:SDR family oxidoreductase n=1 Tax=Streptomyces sp. NPDC046909 TaxID=3155617 RepID=UPI0033F06B72
MTGICEGRVAVVTGAGRGIGREYALELARQGASVVVNDLGGSPDGSGADTGPAQTVVDEIVEAGGKAVANTDDVADWEGAERLVRQAISEFGRLDILVNNAGILRDRALVSMSSEEWDSVIRVHLRGTAGPSHFAAAYWRAQAKKSGGPTGGRIINTTSASGIYGNFGQSNYGAAKAGIASFTLIAAIELKSYGVTVNAIAPVAATRLTAGLGPKPGSKPDGKSQGMPDTFGPQHIAPLVAWLASPESTKVTGRVFDVGGGRIGVAEAWRLGPVATSDGVWNAAELGSVVPELVAKAAPNVTMRGVPAQGEH